MTALRSNDAESTAAQDKLNAALRDSEKMKAEAEEMVKTAMASKSNGVSSDGMDQRVTELFKDTMNSVFFSFQDTFMDADAQYSGKEVLSTIKKILKQSTKDVLNKSKNEDG